MSSASGNNGATPNDPPPSYEETMRLVAMGMKHSMCVPTGYQVIETPGHSQPSQGTAHSLGPGHHGPGTARLPSYTNPHPHHQASAHTGQPPAEEEEQMKKTRRKVYCACFLLTLIISVMLCAVVMILL